MARVIRLPDVTYKDYNERLRTPEQEQAEQLILQHKHFILAFEPGKGKSYPVVHAVLEIQRLKQRPVSVLIMSDAAAIKDMWNVEIIPQNIMPRDTYLVTDRTAIGEVSVALLNKKWDIIIVDECQSLRSGVTRAKSKFAKLVYSLTKKTEYVIGMTGTIMGNINIEPWCVLHNLNVAGCGNISTKSFKNNCCVLELKYGPFGNFYKPTKLNDRGEEIINKAYANGVMFWPYDENDDMPELEIITKTFEVESTIEYQNALKGILKLDDHESTTLKAIALQKAQQALNGFLYFDEQGVRNIYQLSAYKNPKLNYVVEECKKQLTIIGYRFQEDGVAIEEALTKANISWTNIINEFRTTDKYQVLVLQCSRGKAANLQKCQNIIYYTADFSFISYKQFIHRTWRRGQDKPCKVTFLINDPKDNYQVELKIWQSLQTKQNIHDLLMTIKNY